MEFKTLLGRRPDLEAIEVNTPESYIGSMIYPTVNVAEKTGTMYYRTLTSDSAAQTGRVSGAAPSRTLLADSSTTFSVAEVIKRYGVDKAEVKNCGGINQADRMGGMAAKRSVMRAIETAHAAALISSTRYSAASDIHSAIIDGITDAAQSVKRYAGKTAFVCSVSVYQWLVKQTELTGKMGWSFAQGDINSILSLNKTVFKAMLQGIFAFDEVLIGDDDHWSIATMEDAAAVVKLPDPEQFSHKLDPVLGKTMLYMPDGATQPFEIESFYNEDDKINNYDATAWYQIKELNSGAVKLVKGLGTPTT